MSINLLDLFSAATSTLNQSQAQLNEADEQNHDHGSNMVQVFNLITKAIGQKQNDTPSNQLEYASQMLKQNTTSGSGALYSQALQTASQQFKGQAIDENNVVTLIQTLLAGGQRPKPMAAPATSGSDLLGSLLGGLSGGSQQTSSEGDLLGALLGGLTGGGQQSSGGGNVLGSLLGSVLGGGQQSGSGGILGSLLGNLISGGGGAANLLSGFVSGPLAESPTRATSGMLVAQSLIQAAGVLLKKKAATPAKKTAATKSATRTSSKKKTSKKKG